jgi:hypothetical protein
MSDTDLKVVRARLVIEHWQAVALKWGSAPIDARTMAHPLACVLAALNGDKSPEDLGVDSTSDEGKILRVLENV